MQDTVAPRFTGLCGRHRVRAFPAGLLCGAGLWLSLLGGVLGTTPVRAETIRVLVWDERQPAQKQAYTNFLGNQIAEYLKTLPRVTVKSVGLDDPGQGLDDLDAYDVLIWWGHLRHREVKPERAQEIVRRIKEGKLSLVALHAAHWSQPFVEAMKARAREDLKASLPQAERDHLTIHETNLFPQPYSVPHYTDRLTPSVLFHKTPEDLVDAELTLPNCCFPAFRADGKPSQMRVLRLNHPLAEGLPPKFIIEHTEMYNEPFHVPPPDQVVFEERWATGEWFRSGCVWRLGRGHVVYFRPGHEIYPVYKDPNVLKVIANAVLWLGQH